MTGARSPALARATASATGISTLRKRLRIAQARSAISLASRLGEPAVAAGGHDGRDAVLRRIGEHEAAEDRDVEDGARVLGLALLAVVDQLAIGAGVGQQIDRGRRQGQAHERGLGIGQPGQHSPQPECRLLAALDHVDVRVGAIADHEIAGLHHPLGDVGVQVQRHDDARLRPDDLRARARRSRRRGRTCVSRSCAPWLQM